MGLTRRASGRGALVVAAIVTAASIVAPPERVQVSSDVTPVRLAAAVWSPPDGAAVIAVSSVGADRGDAYPRVVTAPLFGNVDHPTPVSAATGPAAGDDSRDIVAQAATLAVPQSVTAAIYEILFIPAQWWMTTGYAIAQVLPPPVAPFFMIFGVIVPIIAVMLPISVVLNTISNGLPLPVVGFSTLTAESVDIAAPTDAGRVADVTVASAPVALEEERAQAVPSVGVSPSEVSPPAPAADPEPVAAAAADGDADAAGVEATDSDPDPEPVDVDSDPKRKPVGDSVPDVRTAPSTTEPEGDSGASDDRPTAPSTSTPDSKDDAAADREKAESSTGGDADGA